MYIHSTIGPPGGSSETAVSSDSQVKTIPLSYCILMMDTFVVTVMPGSSSASWKLEQIKRKQEEKNHFLIKNQPKLFYICIALRLVRAIVICALEVNALVIVALKDSVDHQSLEFGRGFSYNKPLSINMLNVGNALLEQLVSFFYYLTILV